MTKGSDSLFDPDISEGSLGRQAARQGSATVAGQLVTACIQFVTLAVLARLIAPEDFGLVAMVAAVANFIRLFRDVGLTQAIVQAPTISRSEASTLFWINTAATGLLSVLAAAFAPFVARVYGRNELVGIMAVYAAVLFASGLGAVHQAVLARRLEFTRIVRAEIASQAISACVAIGLGAYGYRYWALVSLVAVHAACSSIIYWITLKWLPSRPRRSREAGTFVRFGANLTGFNMLNHLARNADDVIIGRWLGSSSLGYYSRAYALLMLPIQQINAPIARVAIPTLSRLSNPNAYRRAYLRIVEISTAATVPPMAFVIVMSHEVVGLVLGAGWEPAAPVLAWLAVAGLVQPLMNTSGWLLISQGRAKELLGWGAAWACITLSAFLAGAQYGIVGVAAAYSFANLAAAPLLIRLIGRSGPVSPIDMYRVLAFPLVLATGVAVSSLAVRELLPNSLPAAARLFAAAAVAAALSVGVLRYSRAGRGLVLSARGIAGMAFGSSGTAGPDAR